MIINTFFGKKYILWMALMPLLFFSCTPSIDYYNLPTFSENSHLQAVIEIPAGTNHKIEYFPEKGAFEVEQVDGADRIVRYLPYPGNYGFIPSTRMDEEKGGDGDALDVLVLCETMPTGTVVEIIPVGLIQLVDRGEMDDKLVAVPVSPELRTLDATSYSHLNEETKKLIEGWFTQYKGPGKMMCKGWKNEKEAEKEVLKWQKKNG